MIPLFKVNCSPSAKDAVAKVLESGMLGEGPKVQEFTQALRKLFSNENVVALNSCTSALTLALRLCNVQSWQKVLCSPFTFPATSCSILTAGKIEWTRVDHRTFCMDTTDAIKRLDGTVGAVVLTSVGGLLPHGMEELITATRRWNIPLIIDAAHALTTTYKGKHISHWGDYVCFSFQSIKHLTTGDGGALTYKDSWMEDRVERLKWFGISRKIPKGKTRLDHQMEYSIPEWGYKFHMNDIAAAIGLANLQVAGEAVVASRKNAVYYQSVLQSHPTLPEGLEPSWWAYGFNLNQGTSRSVIDKLQRQGIEASPLWKMNNEHQFGSKADSIGGIYPVFIPNGFWVTEDDARTIAIVVGNS